jgi:hypothetical protein
MNLYDLTVNQLKRAVAIKEQIERLTKELGAILGGSTQSRTPPPKARAMSVSIKRKIAASQKARWRRAKSAKRSAPSATKLKKKTISAATRAKLSAKLKAYWAAKKRKTS